MLILKSLILLAVGLSSVCGAISFQNPQQVHAVLISAVPCGMQCDINYATVSEIAETYHLLLDHGVPADNIVTFLNDEVTNSHLNPYPGKLYTDTKLTRDFRAGVPVDYSGENITTQNFLAVIQGQKSKINGGSGRVLESGAENRLFISHEGHGGPGLVLIRDDVMTLKELHHALKNMQAKRMFKEMTYYMMACLSGSMFEGKLQENGPIYAVTAAKPTESAFPKDHYVTTTNGTQYSIYVNTEFGNAWLKDGEMHDPNNETLQAQYENVKPKVQNSSESHYGNLKIAREIVGNFEGAKPKLRAYRSEEGSSREVVESNKHSLPISPIASYLCLKHQQAEAFEFDPALEEKIRAMEAEQTAIHQKVETIAAGVGAFSKVGGLYTAPDEITQIDCHHDVVKTIYRECEQIVKSPFVHEFTTPMVNLCERKVDAQKIIERIHEQCKIWKT